MFRKSHPRLTGLFMTFVGLLIGLQSAEAQISAIAQCPDTPGDSTYVIKITNLDPGTNTIWLDGNIVSTTAVDSFITAPQTFVDGTVSVVVDAGIIAPTSTVVVHEILCDDIDGDGNFDFSGTACDYTQPVGSNGSIIASVAPYNGTNVYLYILTGEDSLYMTGTTPTNYSGSFQGLSSGDYTMWAFNFLNTMDADTFLMNIPNATNMYSYSASAPACYMLCGDASYTVDCESIVDIYVDPTDDMVCLDGDAEFYVQDSFLVDPPAGATLSYDWEVSTDDGLTWGTITDGIAPDSVLTVEGVTLADSGNQYRVIVTMTVGTTDISMDTSGVGTLTVYDVPEIDDMLSVTITSDETTGITLTAASGSVAIDSFEFVSVTFGGLTPDPGNATIPDTTTDANHINGDMYDNTTGGPDTAFYTIVPISEHGCYGDTIVVFVEVLPCPDFNAPDDVFVCSDEESGITLPSTDVNGTTIDSFSITASVGTNLSGTATDGIVSSSSAISQDSFTNVSDVVDSVEYIIIAYANGCESASDTTYVIVTPEPVYDDLAEDVCSDMEFGENIPFSDDTGLGIDSVYIVAVVGDSLTGTAISDTMTDDATILLTESFVNTTSVTDSVVYTITPYNDDCPGESFTMTFRVVPEPVGEDPMTEVCSDELISIDLTNLVTNVSTGLTFEWYAISNSNVEGEDTTTQTTSTISDQISNTSDNNETVVYKVIPQLNGTCVGDTFDVSVTVIAEPVFSDTSLMFCSGDLASLDLSSMLENGAALVGFTYTVTSDNPGVTAEADRILDTLLTGISQTYTNTTNSDALITYTVTPWTPDGCAGDDFDVDITIKPEPVFDDIELTVCSGDPINIDFVDSLVNSSVSILGYTWTASSSNTGEIASPDSRIDTSDANLIDTFTNTTASSIDITYTVTPYSIDTCEGADFTVTITVDPETVVTVGADTSICSTGTVDLSGATITGGVTTGTWTSTGSSGTISGSTYTPSAADIASGSVTLTLTSDPSGGSCPTDSDSMVVTILDISCSTFPWDGNDDD